MHISNVYFINVSLVVTDFSALSTTSFCKLMSEKFSSWNTGFLSAQLSAIDPFTMAKSGIY